MEDFIKEEYEQASGAISSLTVICRVLSKRCLTSLGRMRLLKYTMEQPNSPALDLGECIKSLEHEIQEMVTQLNILGIETEEQDG